MSGEVTVVPASVPVETAGAKGRNIGGIALIVGLVGLALAAAGLFTGLANHDSRPFLGWLIAIAFWLSIAVGMLFLVMIWYVFHARWPTIIRRQCEHCLSVFPWLGLLFLPLLFLPMLGGDPGLVWKWMDPDYVIPGPVTVGHDPLLLAKSAYLNFGFFVARTVGIFAVFIVLAGLLRKWSFDMDRTGDLANFHRSRILSAVGLFLVAGAATIGAIDWFKSLEYHWFSTMYGVWFFAASMRAALSAILLICLVLAARGYLKGLLRQAHRYDIGCMMLAFTVFWAYISFSQYFLIYNANIPEETFWYNIREKNMDGSLNSWWWVSMALIFLHFFLPFFLLLGYKTKVVLKRSVFVAVWILLFHLLDLYWNILPGKLNEPDAESYAYTVRQFSVGFYDLCALVGIGGICLWAFTRSMKKAEPIPVRDPNIGRSLNYHE
jgi:hypothetical protein